MSKSVLETYAEQTAADMDADYRAALRAMRDEPGTVAEETGLSRETVTVWASRQLMMTTSR